MQVQSHKEVQCGLLPVRAGFTYILCLDNTFSKFRAKTVMYSVIMEDEEPNTGRISLIGICLTSIFLSELTVEDIVRLSRDGVDTSDGIDTEKKNNNE